MSMSRNDSNDNLSWFHGKLSREDAEQLVKQEGNDDGTFLIRESNTAVGDFVLTLLYKDDVMHYQIRRHGDDAFFSIDDKVKTLHGLETLVEFYKESPNGLVTKLTKFIKNNPPPNDARGHGVTNLLHRATQSNNATVVSELLKCGYRNIDAKNENGQTAVHLAAIHCDEKILKLLLDAGVNVNCKDKSEHTPLHYACRNKPASFIRVLIAAQANVQGRNLINGCVPLHDAAKYGNLDAVKELLAAHAPLLPRTSVGEFPLDLARDAGHSEVVDFLEKYKQPAVSTWKSYWYHGTLTREEAVKALRDHANKIKQELESNQITEVVDDAVLNTALNVDTSGCFLVRYSARNATGPGYVLTLLTDDAVKNFIISQSSNYLYIDEGPYLPSLEHLVEHFMRFTDGLPIRLKYPVRPLPKPPVPHFSTIPRSKNKNNSIHATKATLTIEKHDRIPKSPSSIRNHQRVAKHSPPLTPKKNSASMILQSLRRSKDKKHALCNDKQIPTVMTTTEELEKSPCKGLTFEGNFSQLRLSSENENSQEQANGLLSPPSYLAPAAPKIYVNGFYKIPLNNRLVRPEDAAPKLSEMDTTIAEKSMEKEQVSHSDVAANEQDRMGAGTSTTESHCITVTDL